MVVTAGKRLLTTTVHKMKTIVTEAFHLSKQIYQTKPTSLVETRQLLHNASRGQSSLGLGIGGNGVALSLLKVDKEIVYMRYEGILTYVVTRFQARTRRLIGTTSTGTTTFSDTRSSKDNNDNRKKGNNQVAKIAFMITNQQKQQLQELHYSPKQIKAMKPIQALLIVENDLIMDEDADSDGQWSVKLEAFVRENENDPLQKEKQVQVQRGVKEEVHVEYEYEMELKNESTTGTGTAQLKFEQPAADVDDSRAQSAINSLAIVPDSDPSSSSKMYKEYLPAQPIIDSVEDDNDDTETETAPEAEAEAEGWYEVIETTNESSGVIALYKSRKEAQECLDIKMDLMNKRMERQMVNGGKGKGKGKGSSGNGNGNCNEKIRECGSGVEYRIQKRA